MKENTKTNYYTCIHKMRRDKNKKRIMKLKTGKTK